MDHIIEYLYVRLNKDETPDALDKGLEANNIKKIVDNMVER